MSELDSFSDSEWLDITSGRDSDDNDSLSDQDSDRDEISSMPRSRRSSVSNESSMASDVEAWEGFVSDSGDEAVTGISPVPLPAAAFGAEPIAVGSIPNSTEAVDPAAAEEDQRVKEALDQSFIGTLSGSRSSTAGGHFLSTHTSIRDLRLSFPDPLSSSRDELNRSYEAVSSPTETNATSSADDQIEPDSVPPIISSPPLEDPGSSSTTPEVRRHVELDSEDNSELEIVLYGSSSEIKWNFVQELMQKAAITSGHVFANSLHDDEQIQTLRLVKQSNDSTPFFNIINIYDRTNENMVKAEVDTFDTSDHPSLAIIYLPASELPNISWHTVFFPVLLPSSLTADGDNSIMVQAAEDDWDLLAVPADKTLKLGTSKSSVFDSEELLYINPPHAYEVLSGIGRETKKITAVKLLTEQVKSVNAVTLFALMSIIMGFAFNTAFHPSTPAPTPTINTPSSSIGFWGVFAPQPNRSIVASSAAYTHAKGSTSGSIVSSSSLKDMALSVLSPGTTSLSVTSPSSMSLIIASTSKAVSEVTTTTPLTQCQTCGTNKSGTPDKPRASTDVVLRSTSTLSEVPHAKPSVSSTASHTKTGSGSTIILAGGSIPKSTIGAAAAAAANLNLNSVSEVLDATTKALTEAVGNDLVEAADELLASLIERTDNVIRQSKGKARAFGEQIQNFNEEVVSRNQRAKKRARELKKQGEDIMRGAREEFEERRERARKRAREIRKTVVDGGTGAWKTYEKVQEEWEGALLGKVKRPGKQSRKEKRKAAAEKENAIPRSSERNCWKPRGSRCR